MHITQYWSENAATTNTLKISCICLTVTTLLSSIFVFYLAKKPPLIVERACFSQTIHPSSASRTEEELSAFVHEGIGARFNTLAENTDLLTLKELKKRHSEQGKFEKKSIKQTMLVDSLQVEGDQVTVHATRLIALKNIRSALPFHLEISIKKTSRSPNNPYGLVIEDVKEVPIEAKKGDGK